MSKITSVADVEILHKKQLKAYIADLEQSVKINKELLQNVLMATNPSDGHKEVIAKYEKEIERLSSSLQTSLKEKCDIIESLNESEKERDEIRELIKDKEK